MNTAREWSLKRKKMVEQQLLNRHIHDPKVLDAMGKIPRELFVPEELRGESYDDRPVPIGFEATISQPYIVAYMAQCLNLKKTDRVLEVGSGSGYNAAILSALAQKVYAIEIVPELAERSRKVLKELGIQNVVVISGDGSHGWPSEAPYDAIVLAAAPVELSKEFFSQLSSSGRILAPVGNEKQELYLWQKEADHFQQTFLLPVRFVPLQSKPTPSSGNGVARK